jgi:hypothetical protein
MVEKKKGEIIPITKGKKERVSNSRIPKKDPTADRNQPKPLREMDVDGLLGYMGEGEDNIYQVLKLLKDESNGVKCKVIIALKLNGGERAVPALLELLKEESAMVVVGAKHAIEIIGSWNKEAVKRHIERFTLSIWYLREADLNSPVYSRVSGDIDQIMETLTQTD